VAARNAARLGLDPRSGFHTRDWEQPGWALDLGGPFGLILANPPYVEDDAPLEAVVRDHEPHGALFAGPEGLDAYRILIPQLPALLAPDGLALVEIGHRQAEMVRAIGAAAGLAATVHRDLGDRPRVIAFSAGLIPVA
ncbi:MAG: peptide chain release factor N(5)-glutamine methyltransferase, partial [Novosphingobium sp.]